MGLSCGMWTLICSMWDPVPWPGIETGPPALGAGVLSTDTKEVLVCFFSASATSFWLLSFLLSLEIKKCEFSKCLVLLWLLMGRSYWMYFWNVFSKFSFVEQRQYAQHCHGPTWGMVAMSAAAAAKSLQSCPTLCDPVDGSPPGSPIPGILQARTLEWVAIFFSNAWKWKVKVKSLSCVWLLATP